MKYSMIDLLREMHYDPITLWNARWFKYLMKYTYDGFWFKRGDGIQNMHIIWHNSVNFYLIFDSFEFLETSQYVLYEYNNI